jgi:hypothetical protein
MLEVEPFTADPMPLLAAPEPSPLEAELIRQGVTAKTAGELVRDFGEEQIRLQIDILDGMTAGKRVKIDDPAAWLVMAIRNGHAAPKHFKSRAQREQEAEAKRQQEQAKAEERRREQEEAARIRKENQALAAFWNGLTPEQQAAHDAAAIDQADAEELKLIEPGPVQKIGMGIVRDNYTRKRLRDQGKLPSTQA